MATKKIKTMEFIRTLQSLNRGFFTVADLEKITGLKRTSLKVTLNRLVNQKLLTRLKRGIYQLSLSDVSVDRVANQLYYPSYLSFESALTDWGVLSQVPFTRTFATCKRSKRMTIEGVEAEFTQLKKDLYFGYIFERGVNLARPEKALLDQIYMVSRGKRSFNIEELDMRNINMKVLLEYSKKYPPYIKKLLKEIKSYAGTTPVTDGLGSRINWREVEAA